MGDYNNAVNTKTQVPQRKTFCFSGPLQNKLLAKEFQEGPKGGAHPSLLLRTQGQEQAAMTPPPSARQLQIGILADLGRTQWVSSVNC